MPGGGRIRWFHQLVVEVRLIDNLSRMTHQIPDSAQYHSLFRLVIPDFLAFLSELLRHCHHLCGKLRLLRLERVHLRLIRHPGYVMEDIPGSTVTQSPAHSTGDVFQLPILVLQVGQLGPDPLEGGFRKLKIGQINILPGLLSAGTSLVAGLRSGCPPWFRNGSGWGWFGDDGVFLGLLRSSFRNFDVRT